MEKRIDYTTESSLKNETEKLNNDAAMNDTGMYIIDQKYRIVNFNGAMHMMYPEVKTGDICYKAIALKTQPCEACPLNRDSIVLFFSNSRKEWISANAAAIEYPGYGDCYCIQFRRRLGMGGAREEIIQMEELDDHVSALQNATGRECVIGAYIEAGSPLFYANEKMVEMMGYDSLEEMSEAIGGLVMNTVHPDDRPRVKRDMVSAGILGATYETTYRMPRKDGSWFWVVTKGKTIKTVSGRLATLSVCTDMTDLVERHEALKEQNQELLQKDIFTTTMVENMPSGYHRCKPEAGCPFLYIGNYFTDIVGYSKEEIAEEFDNLYQNLIWEEDRAVITTYNDMLKMRGKGNQYDTSVYRIKHKDGGYRWVTDSTMFVDMGEDSFFQGTIADITEHIEMLEEAKSRAEASSLAKSTFLFNASHDIRTPMNAIIGFSHIIEENAGNEAVVKNAVNKIKQSSDTLMTLINDILEVARIEKGKEELNNRPLNLQEQTNRLYEMFVGEMEMAGVTLKSRCHLQHANVYSDDLKLTRIGMNLLSNAKKFTPTGGTVIFGVDEIESDGKKNQATYRFYVCDTGIGMSKEFQKRAFEQFERERSSTDVGVPGNGLGLTIIKNITDLMGGTCEINSELGKGTEISVTVTLQLVKDMDYDREPVSLETLDFSGNRVLLVEDNAFNREIARYILENLHFIVEEAENGSICVDKILKADTGYYDLILMDIQMPVMDGYVATKEIRNIKEQEKSLIPIIAMTANAFEEDKQKCIDIGMNGHIGKPIDVKNLVQELAKIL